MFFNKISLTTVQDIALISNITELSFPNFVKNQTHFKLYQTTVNVPIEKFYNLFLIKTWLTLKQTNMV